MNRGGQRGRPVSSGWKAVRHLVAVVGLIIALMGMGLATGGTSLVHAQDTRIPVEVQYPLLMKIMAYNHMLAEGNDDEIVIGIVYQQRYRLSRATQEAFLYEHQEAKPPTLINNIPVRCVALDMQNTRELAAFIERHHIDVLYVAPLRAFSVRRIVDVSRAHGVITLTGTSEYVEHGLAVGIGLNGSRPQIFINAQAAKAEGAQFSARLLQLAHLVDE